MVRAWGDRPFLAFGLAGLAASFAVSLLSASALGLSPLAQLVISLSGVSAFVVLALVTKAITGVESLTYYHHEIAIFVVVGAVAAVWPVLGHLDASALGVGSFLVLGRMGCLLAGCCHGRPASVGIVYRGRPPGLPPYLVGRRLVPVQGIESAAALALVIAGALSLDPDRQGAAAALYVAGYGLVRPVLEELRGDWRRPRWRCLSEAQWTSIALVLVAGVADVAGLLPHGPVRWAPVLLVAELVLLHELRRRRLRTLLDSDHVRELVRACERAAAGPAVPPTVLRTSQGVRLSASIERGRRSVSLSRTPAPLRPDDAALLAPVVAELCLHREHIDVVAGAAGVFHVLAAPCARPVADDTAPIPPGSSRFGSAENAGGFR